MKRSSANIFLTTFRGLKIIIAHLQYLIDKGFPLGLARGVAENVQMFEHRLWLVDNSGSMQIGDGNRILHDGNGNFKKATRGSRWQEIQDTVQYHATMAIEMKSATTFRVSFIGISARI